MEGSPWEILNGDSDFNVLEKVQSQGVHWRVHPMTVTTKTIQSDLIEPIEYDVAL